ncbi:MAG TPA: ABC transporter ATP-binding protein [Bradyrhizobium sp.]|jgi:branched-chain amino acid transport system ATP-binding protein|nr:ABC transporter ATP-binding protein [Bradyrhizobium sp.]
MHEAPALRAGAALVISGLRGWYGDLQALFGIDLHVGEGEVVVLVGRNGAGKTTILRAIMGLLPRHSGKVLLHGQNAGTLRSSERARLGFGYCPEERAVFASLTVAENLSLPPVLGSKVISQDEIFELFPNLRSRTRQLGGQLSGGEQQMLAIARILRSGARTLLLDEPTEGLAPIIIRQIEDAITALKRRGYTILLVEQNLAFALRLADRVIAIENGLVVDQCQAGNVESIENRLSRYITL